MFNATQKKAFMARYNESTQRVLTSTFELLTPVEEEAGRDICTFTQEEVRIALMQIATTTSMNTTQHKFVAVNQYLTWCVSQGYCEENELASTHITDINLDDAMRTTMLRSPSDLAHVFDDIFYPLDKMTVDNMTRLYFWMVWAGVSTGDALCVQHNAVDLLDMSFLYNGKRYVFPKQAHETVNAAMHMQFITIFNRDIPRRTDFSDFSTAVKSSGAANVLAHHQRLARKLAEYDRTPTARSIKHSGIYYRMYRDTETYERYANTLSRLALQEYTAWKRVFWDK